MTTLIYLDQELMNDNVGISKPGAFTTLVYLDQELMNDNVARSLQISTLVYVGQEFINKKLWFN